MEGRPPKEPAYDSILAPERPQGAIRNTGHANEWTWGLGVEQWGSRTWNCPSGGRSHPCVPADRKHLVTRKRSRPGPKCQLCGPQAKLGPPQACLPTPCHFKCRQGGPAAPTALSSKNQVLLLARSQFGVPLERDCPRPTAASPGVGSQGFAPNTHAV